MKSSAHELSEIEFIDFHTHKQIAPPKTLNVFSIELADFKGSVPANIDHNFFSVGLHPWRLPADTDNLQEDIKALRTALKRPKVIALGEVGLDRLQGPDITVQEAYFTESLKLASSLHKTLIIHCVRCYPELLAVKIKFAPDLNVLVHGYNGKTEILEQLFEHGFYVSFGIASLKRDDICEYIRQKPEYFHRICLETDDSGLNIEEIYKRAAKVFEIDIQELKQVMKTNFILLFQDYSDV